jgi:hypothetical protein
MQQSCLSPVKQLASRTMVPTTPEVMAQARGRKEALLCLKAGNGIHQLKDLMQAIREIDTSVWAVTSIDLQADAQNWGQLPLQLSDFLCRLRIQETNPITAMPLQLVTVLLRTM